MTSTESGDGTSSSREGLDKMFEASWRISPQDRIVHAENLKNGVYDEYVRPLPKNDTEQVSANKLGTTAEQNKSLRDTARAINNRRGDDVNPNDLNSLRPGADDEAR